MKKNFLNWSIVAAAGLFVGMFSASTTTVLAQCGECPIVGQPIDCPGSSKSDLEANGYTLTVETLTDGRFIVTSCTAPPPGCPTPWETTLEIDRFEGHGHDPVLGDVHWRNDPSRSVTPSSYFQGYQKDQQFPAFGVIQFYAECEVDGIPGVYRSLEPVRLINHQVHSFNPFRGELFVKDPDTAPVIFVNDQTGDKIALNYLESLLGR